jgi:Tol biopolymer transport system component
MRKSTFALLAILGLLMAVPGFASQEIFGDPIILKDYWDGANRIYAEDLDGDGDIDILATALYEDDITWFENDGSPSFREHTIRGSFDGATRAYAADVDGDGRIDVVGSAANGQLVTWWKNNPSGNDPPSDPIEWTEHTIDGNFPQAMYVHAAYLNGDDTRMDVLAVRGGSYGDVHWWQNAASGNPAPADPVAWTERSISDDFDGANCVYAADVDGDGYTDVIASRHLAQTITWWENSPSGNPPPGDPITWTEHPIGSSLDNPSSVYAADVDLDGHTDILATTIYNDVLWWENHPSGAPAPADPVSWTQHTITDDFYGASSVYAVDMDLDGDTDIVAAASGGGQVAWWEAKPSGNVPPGDPFTWTKHLVHYDDRKPYGVYAADLDNDDDPDIVATVHHGGYVAWWENRTHDPPAGRIAFVSQRDGNFRIYTMDSHGGDQERLTMGQWDWSPSWSPDGSEIYFYSGHGQAQIFKIDINEVDPIPTPVTDDPAFIDAEPACSRDGERLVFQSERDGNMEIYVKDLALGAEQRMTDNPADDGWAAWSPDGSRIVFTSNREGNQDIFIMDYDPDLEDPTQLQPENLTRHPATDMSAAWAPDGTRIAFASTRDGNHEIYSMDLETRVVTRLTCNSRYDGAPAWSPDGKWIAFQTEESGARGIYIMRPTECIPGDRKYERQLTLNLDYAPDWWALPPDGTPPTTIIDVDGTLGDNAWFVSPVEVTLSATDDTGGSGVALTWYSVDGGPWIPYVQPFTIEGEGATTILAYSQDNAGNPEDPPVSEEVRIDFTPPATTIDVDGTLGDNDWFVSPVEVTLSATDDTGGSGVDLTWYSLDGGPWIPYVEPFTIEGEGATTVLAYSQDNAGNPEGPPASEDVNVDYTPPTIAASRSRHISTVTTQFRGLPPAHRTRS